MQHLSPRLGKQAPLWLKTSLEWLLFFLGLLFAFWAATQSSAAPQSILIVVLYVIAINFGLPASRGGINLVPVIAVSSLLVVAYPPAIALSLLGSALAELARPLWIPLWQPLGWTGERRSHRLGHYLAQAVALAGAGWVYALVGGEVPAPVTQLADLAPFFWLSLAYVGLHLAGTLAVDRLHGQPTSAWLRGNLLPALSASLLAQPFGLFGGILFSNVGLPAFVMYSLGLGAFAFALGLSWQRRYVLQEQLAQLSALNQASRSLRETLDLPGVLWRLYHQVTALVPADAFAIALVSQSGEWELPLQVIGNQPVPAADSPEARYIPDDFTAWVVARGRVLDLDPSNMHYAARHRLSPPEPMPASWFGVPLVSKERTIGALVLQRYEASAPFSRWSREVLLSVAGQASSAIENARLHQETVRLYNLTDEALARRVEQLQALLDSTREGVLMLDTGGRVVLVNPPAAAILACEAAELQGRELAEAQVAAHLGYSPEQLGRLVSDLAGGQAPAPHRFTYQLHPAGGRARTIERNGSPVLASGGQVMGWLIVLRDVTEERELAEWRSDVTRMIVHDLRNPVTSLLSTINRLEEQVASGDGRPVAGRARGVGHLVETARRGCVNMIDMIDSLMDVQRMEAGQLVVEAEAMHLEPLVQRVLDHLRPLAEERNITLSFALPAGLPPIWADEQVLRRVLVNLLDNALKFTPAGGVVKGMCQPEMPATPPREPGVRCTICDSGPGVPPDQREHIFGRYTRINRGGAQVRGTGLGLTFCKLAVEAQGGRIWVEDGPDGGSQFVFVLPGLPILP